MGSLFSISHPILSANCPEMASSDSLASPERYESESFMGDYRMAPGNEKGATVKKQRRWLLPLLIACTQILNISAIFLWITTPKSKLLCAGDDSNSIVPTCELLCVSRDPGTGNLITRHSLNHQGAVRLRHRALCARPQR